MRCDELTVCKAELFLKRQPVADVERAAGEALEAMKDSVRPGMRVAVAVGSRGVANIARIAGAAVRFLADCGAKPFIIPAMGSHGGATDEGQREVLAGYGVTEQAVGAPVLSSMEAVQIGEVAGNPSFPVYMDKNAYEADGVLVINRVKSHTDFHGYHESGIVKMLVIGLGKKMQAETMHRFGADGLRDLIPKAAKAVLDSGRILGGLAVLEDGAENTSDIVFASPERFFEVDHAVLMRSKELMAKLPFEDIDLLLIDRMGKDISGTGMDTNVIGRLRIDGQQDQPPRCGTIVVLDLTGAGHGNATGVGLADITTRRLADKIDWQATNANVITSGFYNRGFLPIVVEDDETALNTAMNGASPDTIRFVRIADTLRIDEVYLSRPLMEELAASGRGKQLGDYQPLSFQNGAIGAF